MNPATLALTLLGLVTGCALVCKWLDAADARRCRWARETHLGLPDEAVD